MYSCSVSEPSGGDAAVRSTLKNKCEEFCEKIPFKGRLPSTKEREQLNKHAVDALSAAYPDYNTLVVSTEHEHGLQSCTHVQLEFSHGAIGSITFHVYVFKSGEFTLVGDGGFINWCFSGNFTREPADSKVVKFSNRV